LRCSSTSPRRSPGVTTGSDLQLLGAALIGAAGFYAIVSGKLTKALFSVEYNGSETQEISKEVSKHVVCFELPKTGSQPQRGCGVIVSESGFIVTNSLPEDVKVGSFVEAELYDQKKVEAVVHSHDEDLGLSILKLKSHSGGKCSEMDAQKKPILAQGDAVVCISCKQPQAQSTETATLMKVSSASSLAPESPFLDRHRLKYFRTQPHASVGGVLFSSRGEFVGLSVVEDEYVGGDDTAEADSKESYATHADSIMNAARQLIANGRVVRPYVGVDIAEVATVQSDTERRDKTQDKVVSAVVERLEAGSPAATAGITP
jgi:S1-C subfamily serine protease